MNVRLLALWFRIRASYWFLPAPMVALSQASSQFGPPLLINFMRDTGNLLRQAAMIHRAAGEPVAAPEDRAAIEERYRRLSKVPKEAP